MNNELIRMKLSLSLTILAAFLSMSTSLRAQIPGCMDMNANNYASSATINDGSCVYSATNYTPTLITALDAEMDESSALIISDGVVWTLNDSGNPAEIYQMDTLNGTVLRKVYIKNAINHDWEAMAQNDSHIFLGDFGNNLGNRQNLRILKISKSELNITTNDSVQAEMIRFVYPEQTNFAPGNNMHDFDCEGFFFAGDSLHLFTKNWFNQQTNHYVLPADTGSYNARLAESFNVGGLITDASIDVNSGHVVLLGYKNLGFNVYMSFTWLLSDYEGTRYFSGNKRKIDIGNALQLGQTEGIHLHGNNTGLISAESIVNSGLGVNEPAKLHRFNFDAFFPRYQQPGMSINDKKTEEGILFPNPANEYFTFKSSNENDVKYTLYNMLGQAIMSGVMHAGENIVYIDFLENGSYYLRLDTEKYNKPMTIIKN